MSTGRIDDRSSISTLGRLHDGIHLQPLNVDDPTSDDTNTDGLALGFVEETTPVFYGDSSSIVFTRCLLEAIAVVSKPKESKDTPIKAACERNGASDRNPAPVAQPQSPSVVESPRDMASSPTAQPSEGEMDALLCTYFSGYGCLFAFLHEPTFRETYNECKANGFVKARRGWLGLLNMTFAMAAHIDQAADTSAKYRFKRSYVFFQRAVSLCSEMCTRTISLDIVQYLLLAALYLQGTQRPIQAWTVHGMLVRTAMALGLHSEKSSQGLHPVQQEVRRRTWLTIYCLDKIQSVQCGRPPAIPDEYIVVKMPSPWPTTVDTERDQVNDVDNQTAFIDATVRLLQVVGQSIRTQYGQNLGLRDHEVDDSTAIQAASVVRQELRRWACSLPPSLAICGAGSCIFSEEESSESIRMRVILTLRYHFVNILIHRPLLCATLRYLTINAPPVGAPLPYRMQLAMAEAHECIRSAEETIEIVHTVMSGSSPSYTKLDVWFFTLFHVFNAALIIIGRSVLEQHRVYVNDGASSASSAQYYLNQSVEALDKLDIENRLVRNCAKVIRRLAQPQNGKGEGPTPAEQYPPVNHHIVQFENEGDLSSLGLPSLSDLDIVQFSSGEMMGNGFGETSLSLDQLYSDY
ncbi:fungal specific transcription factor domain-containing protein [Aspergillus mulundensis]|uniref:Xylanolytic transcriptional activator regulatory domain-containing protein n=1 Tax=Aspergillus mulundensis TaxID=1810919 RepID=A0A3D8QVU9_9EURO|nr:Uncharacterized protein DSM5745_09685 [Aspergillus mulundensis]RDW65946.1 Uncharacterized protein DSM5745_09685 [Aspergillus mulundensis]